MLLQDESRRLYSWFASKPESRRLVRESEFRILNERDMSFKQPFSILYSAVYEDSGPFDVLAESKKKVERVTAPADMLDFQGALLIWGGSDISPDFYNHPMSRRCAPYAGRRDRVEWELLQEAIQMDMPIIGICRGAQMLCAAAGGFLLQDVNGHAGWGHDVQTFDGKKFKVNSLHHQMMAGFENLEHELVAWSDKNVGAPYIFMDDQIHVPAAGWKEPEFIYFPKIRGYAIQWHPEMLAETEESTQYIMKFIREKEEVVRRAKEKANAA